LRYITTAHLSVIETYINERTANTFLPVKSVLSYEITIVVRFVSIVVQRVCLDITNGSLVVMDACRVRSTVNRWIQRLSSVNVYPTITAT